MKSTFRRVCVLLTYFIAMLVGSGALTAAPARAYNSSFSFNNPTDYSNYTLYTGISGAARASNEGGNNYVTPLSISCIAARPTSWTAINHYPGYDCYSRSTYGGCTPPSVCPQATWYANYEYQDNYGSIAFCYPRTIGYSFGGTYDYWGSPPDSRCGDFGTLRQGVADACVNGTNHLNGNDPNHEIIKNGVDVGYAVPKFDYRYAGTSPTTCVGFGYNNFLDFHANAGINIQDQLSGRFYAGPWDIQAYTEGGIEESWGGYAFEQLSNCQAGAGCTSGILSFYVRYQIPAVSGNTVYTGIIQEQVVPGSSGNPAQHFWIYSF